MSTPVVRLGPTSRLLRRQSGLPEPRNLKEQIFENINMTDFVFFIFLGRKRRQRVAGRIAFVLLGSHNRYIDK